MAEFIGRPHLPEALAKQQVDLINDPNAGFEASIKAITNAIAGTITSRSSRQLEAQKILTELLGKGQLLPPEAKQPEAQAQPLLGAPDAGAPETGAMPGAAPMPTAPQAATSQPPTGAPGVADPFGLGQAPLPDVTQLFPELRGRLPAGTRFKSFTQLKEEGDMGQQQIFVDPAQVELFNPQRTKTEKNPGGDGIDLTPFLGQWVNRSTIVKLYESQVRGKWAEASAKLKENAINRNGRVTGRQINAQLGIDVYPPEQLFPGSVLMAAMTMVEKRTKWNADFLAKSEPITAMQSLHKDMTDLAKEAGGGGRFTGLFRRYVTAPIGLDPSVAVWEQMKQGFLSQYGRILGGEKGPLSDGDIERIRAINLRPEDTDEEFQRKAKFINNIIATRVKLMERQRPGGPLSQSTTVGNKSGGTPDPKDRYNQLKKANPKWSPDRIFSEMQQEGISIDEDEE